MASDPIALEVAVALASLRKPFAPLLAVLALGLAPLGVATAAEVPADPHQGISGKLAEKLYNGLGKVFQAIVTRASRSERIDLRMTFSMLDAQERMLFDFSGTVKVKVPTAGMRERLDRQLEDGESVVASSNGSISTDFVMAPIAKDGDEYTLAIQLDLTILTHELFGEIVRNAAQTAGVIALSSLAVQALEALAGFNTEVAGHALELGVKELPNFLSGEAGAITYAAFQDEAHKSFKDKLKETVTPRGLVKHFTLAIIFAGVTGGMKALGATVGGAVAAALIPGGGTFLGTIAATGALVWFGNWTVNWIAVKLPVLWKLAKIGRLYRKANEATGSDQEKRARRFVEYRQDVIERALTELDRGYKQWTFLNMVIRYFTTRVKKKDPSKSDLEGLDIVPYQPMVDSICKKLAMMATRDRNWYAARMYYQLRDSVNQLDRLPPGEAPPAVGVWDRVVNGD